MLMNQEQVEAEAARRLNELDLASLTPEEQLERYRMLIVEVEGDERAAEAEDERISQDCLRRGIG